MPVDYESIKQQVNAINDELVRIRRALHENPELGFMEMETAELIKKKLDSLKIPYKAEIARTGIVATIDGQEPGKTLLIRADMDALPMQEDTNLPFKSKNEGVMHACGHDVHVSCLLGVAEILANQRNTFKGQVKLIFQPAEEGSTEYDPTNQIAGGAKPMILEGALGDADNLNIDGILALHVTSGENDYDPVGNIGLKDGPFTGSADEFYITIKGKGGHASAPHHAVDPVYIAAQIYINIQGWLSRVIDPMEPVVFTVGKIAGGFRQNIISETSKMDCTLRTLNEEVRNKIKAELPKLIKTTAQAYGGDVDIEIRTGYPVGVNSKEINEHVRNAFSNLYSADNIVETEAQLGAEDFYEFGFKNKYPIAMFWLGGANLEKGYTASNHSNYFQIDEASLAIGTSTLVGAALSFLNDARISG